MPVIYTRIGFLAPEHRIELNPGHVSFCYIGLVAACTRRGRSLCSGVVVWLRMMSKSEESPPVRCGKLLAVFYGRVYPVEFTVEEPAPGGFCTGAVGKGGVEDAGQFLDNDCPLRKNSVLQVRVYILFLDIHMVEFREACIAAVEAVGCQRRSHKNPFAIIRRQLQSPLRIKNCGRSRHLGRNGLRSETQPTHRNHSD